MEEYFFNLDEKVVQENVFVLVIYDIAENKKRAKLAKYLQSFGFRVQKSAFEAMISKRNYRKLLDGISKYVGEEDSVKVYKIVGNGQVTNFGKRVEIEQEDVIVI